ncbi:hypothetical protein NDU88_002124 [Pleurodeles waltl]|uniref:Uncharacterized protein n=1 Tax=Pleurodeles waltl TaxID=8319 RepID=A0AAV7MLT4_PLEWA|nr:hypothetical protein NDU88_002124 [Pleurodeles waltl]
MKNSVPELATFFPERGRPLRVFSLLSQMKPPGHRPPPDLFSSSLQGFNKFFTKVWDDSYEKRFFLSSTIYLCDSDGVGISEFSRGGYMGEQEKKKRVRRKLKLHESLPELFRSVSGATPHTDRSHSLASRPPAMQKHCICANGNWLTHGGVEMRGCDSTPVPLHMTCTPDQTEWCAQKHCSCTYIMQGA